MAANESYSVPSAPSYGMVSPNIGQTWSTSIATPIRAEPESPRALRELAEATGEYARAAEAFIFARDALNDAGTRLELCTKIATETRTKENV